MQKPDKQKMNLEKKKNMTFKSYYVAAIFLIALVPAAIYLTGDDNGDILEKQETKINKEGLSAHNDSGILGCDLFSGRWVFDKISYPLYRESQCSFMLDDYACQKYGRTDSKYQQWRWQPHQCNLPRFDGTAFLEKIRGKRLAFVGDSLNKNQWTSMLCLIESSLGRSSPKLVVQRGNLFILHAIEYNATIEFYWSPLLVESNCDDPEHHHGLRDRIIRVMAIEKHARHWTDADIIIFDSFMWWLEPTMTILWGSFESSDAIYQRVEMRTKRYEMALNTWSDWLEMNINRTKTKLFFMSLSPCHFHGESWDVEQNCYKETEPILKEDYWGIATDREMMHVAESSVRKLEKRGLKIEYLNITNLSDYRKDAHPSIYRKFFESPSEEQLANPKTYSDCVHWCLPGVPDATGAGSSLRVTEMDDMNAKNKLFSVEINGGIV
ncbi:protein trichome birefringence-like 34 [Phtheirospermum japonicum]|uniref:Protein trichome birefringence-like 34 n=1 Tax=Phtheirospermum japonicum TaxID=374723 RepID=A0A830C0Y8_9LAMI|nr:protein trichome birefringence-like 34 [Phtheirospermum japonicum]